MANKVAHKVPVDKKRFMEVLKLMNCSIRKLGEAYNEIERTEKTIRRCLNNGEMPPDLLNKIAKYLNLDPDLLAGVYHKNIDNIEDAHVRSTLHSQLKPEKFPYLLKTQSEIEYTTHFENTLAMNGISIELFNSLPPEERVLFHQELRAAIMGVIAKHFTHDSLGKDLHFLLSYYEGFVGDYDPTSYFMHFEGIGLSEEELFFPQN